MRLRDGFRGDLVTVFRWFWGGDEAGFWSEFTAGFEMDFELYFMGRLWGCSQLFLLLFLGCSW